MKIETLSSRKNIFRPGLSTKNKFFLKNLRKKKFRHFASHKNHLNFFKLNKRCEMKVETFLLARDSFEIDISVCVDLVCPLNPP